MKDYIKFSLIIPKIIISDKIIDYNIIISEINSQIPILKKIYCNSMKKLINYSNKKITKKDLIIVQDDNFCPLISNNITINKCFKGLLFKDFVSKGGKCCYLRINTLNKDKKEILCVALTKFSRKNNFFINIYIKNNKPQIEEFTNILVCDDVRKSYNSLTNQWTVIEDKL